jgi:hypothetical protein
MDETPSGAPLTPTELLADFLRAQANSDKNETNKIIAAARQIVIPWMVENLKFLFPGKDVLPIPSESKAWDKPGVGIGVFDVEGEDVIECAKQLGPTYHSARGIIVNLRVIEALRKMKDQQEFHPLSEFSDDLSDDLIEIPEGNSDEAIELEIYEDED